MRKRKDRRPRTEHSLAPCLGRSPVPRQVSLGATAPRPSMVSSPALFLAPPSMAPAAKQTPLLGTLSLHGRPVDRHGESSLLVLGAILAPMHPGMPRPAAPSLDREGGPAHPPRSASGPAIPGRGKRLGSTAAGWCRKGRLEHETSPEGACFPSGARRAGARKTRSRREPWMANEASPNGEGLVRGKRPLRAAGGRR